MKKYVIYTALTGSYDSLVQPKVIDADFDYICFTDCVKSSCIGVWNIKQIPLITHDMQRLSRFPKMHPHVLLNDYMYSVYIDANVCIYNKEFYDKIKEKINDKILLSGIKHPLRQCVYKEFFNVWKWRKEQSLTIMRKEFKFLKKHNFPAKYGMYEANVIFRNHHDMKVIAQCEQWWLMLNLFSKRDQLAYSFTLWQQHLTFDFLCEPGPNRENDYYYLENHKSSGVYHSDSFLKRLSDKFMHCLFYDNCLGEKLFNAYMRI